MAAILSTLVTRLRRLSRVAIEESGVAAVEFSLILPILITLWIGGVEVTGALSVDRRLNALASSMGDLVARTKTITYDQVTDVFNLSEAALFPYSNSGLSMRISAVDIDDDGNAKVAWSRSYHVPRPTVPGQPASTGELPAYSKNTNVDTSVPVTLRPADNPGQLIMAEVRMDYRPVVGYIITGDLELNERMFFVPRLTKQVKICPTAESTSCVASI
jgi:Flp pilus assembly protein TadG